MSSQNPETQQNLYKVLAEADQKIMKALRKSIMLVGNSRSGKSTVFNWSLYRDLIGKREGRQAPKYVVNEKAQNCAKIGSSFTSVTTVPNVQSNYKEKQFEMQGDQILKEIEQLISFLDMAGYGDTRGFVKVIAVSYCLKSVFDQVREAKFIIVMEQNEVNDSSGRKITELINNFLKMFNFKAMSKDHFNMLKKSVSVVITKATPNADLYGKMNEVIGQLQNPEYVCENKKQVIELLEYIVDQNMIQNFDKAVENVPAPECKIVENFNKKKWSYFNLDKVEPQLNGEKLITLPFQSQFNCLSEDQKEKFKTSLGNKVTSFKKFKQIIGSLMQCYNQSWKNCLEKWVMGQSISQKYINADNMFLAIERYIRDYDDYQTDKSDQFDQKFSDQPKHLLTSLNTVIEIQSLIAEISMENNCLSEAEGFQLLIKKFSQIFARMKYFSSCEKQLNLIVRLEYIIIQGLKEMIKLYELDSASIHGISRQIPDGLNGVLVQENVMKYQIIKSFAQNNTALSKAFPTLEQFDKYEDFFDRFMLKFGSQYSRLEMSKIKLSICENKAHILFQDSKKKAVKYFIECLIQITNIINCLPDDSQLTEQDKQRQLDGMYLKNCKIIKKIANILKNQPMSQSQLPKLALQLCKHHNIINLTSEIYEIIIKDSQLPTHRLKQILDEYADYCIQSSRLERARQVLLIKLEVEEDDMNEQKATAQNIANKIEECMKQASLETAKNKMRNWGRVQVDERYEILLNEIKQNVEMI